MINPYLQIILLQFKEFWREPAVLFWSLLFPMGLAGVLGIAFTNKVEDQKFPMALVVIDSASESYSLLSRAPSAKLVVTDSISALNFLKRGEVMLIAKSTGNGVEFLFDPANEEARLASDRIKLEMLHLKYPPLDVKESYLVQQGSRYIDFLVPGLLALGLMNSCIWGIGWNLIDLRIKKLMRRMVATPMRKPLFFLAQMATRLIIASVEFIAVLIFAVLLFKIKITGDPVVLVTLLISGVVAFGGIAVLMGSRAANPQVGNGLINAITLPMMLLSGIFFSYEGFPEWSKIIIQTLPLTQLSDTMRAIFNEGAGWEVAWAPILILNAIGFTALMIGVRIFKWY